MTNKTYRKITSLILCLVMMLSMNMQAIALTIDDIELFPKESEVESDAQVQSEKDKIDAIGMVEHIDDSSRYTATLKVYKEWHQSEG